MLKLAVKEGAFIELHGPGGEPLGEIVVCRARSGTAKLDVILDKSIRVLRSNARNRNVPSGPTGREDRSNG